MFNHNQNDRLSRKFIASIESVILLLAPVATASALSTHNNPARFRLHSQDSASAASQKEISVVAAGQSLERSLAGGETHALLVMLAGGQYLKVVATQRGIDVVLKLFAPGGQKLVETDSLNATQGPEAASVIAQEPGAYRIEISSPGKGVPSGSYQATIEIVREATEQDRQWIEAQKAYVEGIRLMSEGTAPLLEAAIEKFNEASLGWQAAGDQVYQSHALFYMGEIYNQLGQPQRTLEHYFRALRLLESVGETRDQASLLFSIGVAYADLDEQRKALEYLNEALGLWKATNDVFGEARTLDNIGLTLLEMGEPKDALSHYAGALSIWQRVGNSEGAANVLGHIARVYRVEGKSQEALLYYNQSLAIYRSLGRRRSQAEVLNNMGVVYNNLGEFKKAIEFYEQALALWEASGDQQQQGLAIGNIGRSYFLLGDRKKALKYYAVALDLTRKSGARRSEGLILQRMGDLHSALNDQARALEFYNQALTLQRAIENRAAEASVLTGIGLTYVSMKDSQKAIECFNQALALLKLIRDPREEAKALHGLSLAERAVGNLTEARSRIEEAISKAESMRASVDIQELRYSYLASVRRYYEDHIDLLMALHRARPAEGFDALAIENSERARARSLLDLLTEAGANIGEGVDASLARREQELRLALNAKARRQFQLHGRRGRDDQAKALDKEISEIENQLRQIEADIRKSNPHYANLVQPQPLSLREIQAQLDEESLLVEYSLGESRGYVWAVAKDSIKSYELPGRGHIERAARQVYELLTARSLSKTGETARQRQERIAQADARLKEAARLLSEMVLGPIALEIRKKRLIIVADGPLQYIPFAALPAPKSSPALARSSPAFPTSNAGLKGQDWRPLAVDHEIISLPSISALAIQRKETARRKMAEAGVAVIADAVFDSSDVRLKGRLKKDAQLKQSPVGPVANTRKLEHIAEHFSGPAGKRVSRLPFTRIEAERILAVAHGAANLKLVGFEANRAAATGSELGKYRYVHFATHGYVDSERPELSALVLSLVDERGQPQDGFLRAHEIYGLSLSAELVVLSACQTGLGKEIRGEGMVGLTRGFMYAGAPRVLVSLWNVSDRATADLMGSLYSKMLRRGQTPAAALRAAQVEMWKNQRWRSPYYWAAFVLQGEWK
jgi:CHAT domain-containing protein/Tfp pilus assembly protein PilF